MERYQEIEHSLHKRFSKTIWNRFVGSIKQYELLSPGDRVAVCISGGKDSMLLAKCMQQLQRVSDFPFELRFLVMDPGYLPANRALIPATSAPGCGAAGSIPRHRSAAATKLRSATISTT